MTPPDRNQCQAEKPNGANAFTCGGTPQMIRCNNKPTCIAVEISPGYEGAMTLCDNCKEVFLDLVQR